MLHSEHLPDKLAPSILSADFARLGDEIRAVEKAGADMIHFDVMDGHFVPNLSIGIPVLESVRKVTRLPLDAHLMIEQPERYVAQFVKAGANSISVHCEVCPDIPAMAKRIRELGARASIGINPETDADRVLPFAEHLDMILVMSVHPGFGGQEFIPAALDKLRHIRRELKRRGLSIDVEIDGGVKLDNIADVKAAGANVFVSGSGIFGKPDYSKIMGEMRDLIGHEKFSDAISRGAASLAHARWNALNKAERSRTNDPGRKGVIKMWARMSEEERSTELKRRARVRKENRRLRALGLLPPDKH